MEKDHLTISLNLLIKNKPKLSCGRRVNGVKTILMEEALFPLIILFKRHGKEFIVEVLIKTINLVLAFTSLKI